jgi:hypothetical protein
MNDEFYVGWEKKAAAGIGRTVRRAVMGIILLAILLPILLAVSQRLIGASVFEWGEHKTVAGVLEARPYPHLLVPRPGKIGGEAAFSAYYLVMPWKFGLTAEAIARFEGKFVAVKGTLIYRENQTMIETRPEWIVSTNGERLRVGLNGMGYENLGRETFVGEIVDSKCFLGVMNPGQLTPHRACAIRCISGGCPPILVVRPAQGPPICLLLVSAAGKPVNAQVLDKVAEPLQITGEVERRGDLLILRADPATYQRVD